MIYFSGLWMLKYKKSQIAKGQYKDYLVGQLTRCTLYRFQLSKNVFISARSFGYDTYKYEASGKVCLYNFHKMIPGQNTAGRWTLYWSQPSCVDCDEKKRSLAPAVILAGDRLCLKMITTPPSPVTVSHTGSINGTIKPLSTLHWIRFLQCKSQIIW